MNQHIYIYSVFTHASSFSVFILFLFFHVLLPVLFFAIPQWFRLRLIARTATERTIIQIIPAILSFRVASLPCTMLVQCNNCPLAYIVGSSNLATMSSSWLVASQEFLSRNVAKWKRSRQLERRACCTQAARELLQFKGCVKLIFGNILSCAHSNIKLRPLVFDCFILGGLQREQTFSHIGFTVQAYMQC